MNKDKILKTLDYYFPDPKIELHYKKDYELLLAVMLSAQTTDKRVNIVTDKLFKKYDSLEKLNTLSIAEIEKNIKTIGMYRNKAKNFKGIVSYLISHDSKVPRSRKELENMPGVGRKTTNVVLNVLFDEPAMAVDTHVLRVSKRLGFTDKTDDVNDTEKKLMRLFDKKYWNRLHLQLVLFGRYYCTAKKPKCEGCKFQKICQKEKLD